MRTCFYKLCLTFAVDHQHGLGSRYCRLVYLHTGAQVAKKTQTVRTETKNVNEHIQGVTGGKDQISGGCSLC